MKYAVWSRISLYASCPKKLRSHGNWVTGLELTHICNFTLLSCRNTVFTLKSIPTVLTKAEVNESSAYLNKNEVFPTELLPIINNLNM